MKKHPVVLVIWHAALYPSYRKPFCLLNEQFGWDVHLLTAPSWRQALPQYTRIEYDENESIEIHAHSTFFKFHGALHIQPTFPWLFKRIQPDILYIMEEPFSIMGWLCAYWCQRHVPGIPYILYTYQDIPKRYPPPFLWMERFVLRHAARMMVSNTKGGLVLQSKGFKKQWDVLPSAVNLDRFTYHRPFDESPLFTMGYVGRLCEEKGLEDLLWSLVDLDDNIRLRLIGDGPARHRLEIRAKELGLSERVAFMKPVPHEKLPLIYHELDVLILPSRTTSHWQEQFGRVLIEAMACGTPVIGSDSGAIPEVIGDAGLVFPEQQPKALSERILMLYQDFQLRQRLSLQGRVRVEQLYSAECVARKLHHHFIEVLKHASST